MRSARVPQEFIHEYLDPPLFAWAGLFDTSFEMFKLCELGASQHPAGIDDVGDQILLGLIARPELFHPPQVKRLQFLAALAGKNPPRRCPKSVPQGVLARLRLPLRRDRTARPRPVLLAGSDPCVSTHIFSS